MGLHLESVELIVAEHLVLVLVQEPEDACEGLGARGPQLQGQLAQHPPPQQAQLTLAPAAPTCLASGS